MSSEISLSPRWQKVFASLLNDVHPTPQAKEGRTLAAIKQLMRNRNRLRLLKFCQINELTELDMQSRFHNPRRNRGAPIYYYFSKNNLAIWQ